MITFGKKFNVPDITDEQRKIINKAFADLEELAELQKQLLEDDIEYYENIELQKARYHNRDKIRSYNKLLQLNNEDILALLELILPYTSIYSEEYLDSFDFCNQELLYSEYMISEKEQLKQRIGYITRFADKPTHEIKKIIPKTDKTYKPNFSIFS